ncbi:MAG: TIGR03435 family protein [Acidobacteriota bacterium]
MQTRRPSSKSLLNLAAALPLAFNITVHAQQPQEPAFDVVSIRAIEATHTTSTALTSTTITTAWKPCIYAPDRVTCQLSLERLIEEAFQLKSFQIALPSWAAEDRFVLQATLPLNTPKDTARIMLQHALEERFHLTCHRETRQVAVYAMVAATDGVKLQPADDAGHRKLLDPQGQPKPLSPGQRGAYMTITEGHYAAVAISLDIFAINVQNIAGLDLPVVNQTNLTGQYKIDVRWNPDDDADDLPPGVYSGFKAAAERQLGLHLEKRKAPMTVLVIEHADQLPSAN